MLGNRETIQSQEILILGKQKLGDHLRNLDNHPPSLLTDIIILVHRTIFMRFAMYKNFDVIKRKGDDYQDF